MKIKTIIANYECKSCGSLVEARRDLILDKYFSNKLEIPIEKCGCKGKNLKLLDLKIEEKESPKEEPK